MLDRPVQRDHRVNEERWVIKDLSDRVEKWENKVLKVHKDRLENWDPPARRERPVLED